MIKSKTKSKPFIDISGPAGNAFALLGTARQYAKQLGLDQKVILEDMQSKDYEHLIEVFDEHFGEYVDLIR